MNICHDCGVKEGRIHQDGCDMERCPNCGGQLISCDCDHNFEEEDRIPYIQYPIICSKCGERWPEFFRVENNEWEKYIEPGKRNTVICWECYSEIKRLIDETH